MGRRDPLEEAADGETDLQGIATWEPRSLLDRFLAGYAGPLLRASVVALGLLIFAGVLALFAFQVFQDPRTALVLVLFPISVVPALAIAAYVWYTDITTEPLSLLVITYVLGNVLASFPFVINTAVGAVIGAQTVVTSPVGETALQVLNFFLVVGPVEETAKLGAVYVYAYHRAEFDTVVDGAVYGAFAGLGFATIENVSYIIGTLSGAEGLFSLAVSAGLITTVRSLAGPGHVIWTGIAGYYLGLAKFNDDYGAPLVAKGLIIAAVVHATYNTVATVLGGAATSVLSPLVALVAVFGFIVLYQTTFGAYLFVRIRRYRKRYEKFSGGGATPTGGPGPRGDSAELSSGDEGDSAGWSSGDEDGSAGWSGADEDEDRYRK